MAMWLLPLTVAKADEIMMIDTVLIGVTYECQCDCVHCGAALSRDRSRKELDTGEIKHLIDECRGVGTESIGFFGGEPLLREDILELILHARSRGFCTNLDTNGYLLTENVGRALKTAGLDIIGVSLDSSDPDTHDRLRGREGIFSRATGGIRHCVAEGIKCYVSTYANHENVADGDLLRIIDLARSLKADWIRICAPFAAGKWISSTEKRLTPEEREYIVRICDEDPKYTVLEDRDGCPGMQRKLIYISNYGDVQPCCYVPVTFGNIRGERLADILSRIQDHTMYKTFGTLSGCPMNSDAFRRQYLKPFLAK
jgi:MoaA/NifB/PqqE/SkfB family radical SAM enzyme